MSRPQTLWPFLCIVSNFLSVPKQSCSSMLKSDLSGRIGLYEYLRLAVKGRMLLAVNDIELQRPRIVQRLCLYQKHVTS